MGATRIPEETEIQTIYVNDKFHVISYHHRLLLNEKLQDDRDEDCDNIEHTKVCNVLHIHCCHEGKKSTQDSQDHSGVW